MLSVFNIINIAPVHHFRERMAMKTGRKFGAEKEPTKDGVAALKYFDAVDVKEIAEKLIPEFHNHLKDKPIMYLFNAGKMSDWATMAKRSAKEVYISGYLFLMEVNHAQWLLLSEEGRIALVDHELCHAGIDLESGDTMIIDHDVEEFGAIVQRRGFWREDLKLFGRACGEQLELLASKEISRS